MMNKNKVHDSNSLDMQQLKIEKLLIKAINQLTASQTDFLETIKQIVEYYEDQTGYHPVLTVSKDDLRQRGLNPNHLTAYAMRNFAKKMSTDYLIESFWFALDHIAEQELNLPELRTEIDDLYQAYQHENKKEPLYAIFWLEDKEWNKEPWMQVAKLTRQEGKNHEDFIYRYFAHYEEFKDWLFSLEEDTASPDSWCYDDPQHRIQFLDKPHYSKNNQHKNNHENSNI